MSDLPRHSSFRLHPQDLCFNCANCVRSDYLTAKCAALEAGPSFDSGSQLKEVCTKFVQNAERKPMRPTLFRLKTAPKSIVIKHDSHWGSLVDTAYPRAHNCAYGGRLVKRRIGWWVRLLPNEVDAAWEQIHSRTLGTRRDVESEVRTRR